MFRTKNTIGKFFLLKIWEVIFRVTLITTKIIKNIKTTFEEVNGCRLKQVFFVTLSIMMYLRKMYFSFDYKNTWKINKYSLGVLILIFLFCVCQKTDFHFSTTIEYISQVKYILRKKLNSLCNILKVGSRNLFQNTQKTGLRIKYVFKINISKSKHWDFSLFVWFCSQLSGSKSIWFFGTCMRV